MKFKDLETLLEAEESETLEFKKSTAQLKAAFETLCGFLNAKGGTVVIGVADDGKILGQDVSDKTQQEIAREILRIEPPAHPSIDYIKLGNKKIILVLRVKAGAHAPYVYDGRPYYRNQSVTERMPQHKYDQLLLDRNQFNYSWEKTLALKYSLDMLDEELILGVVRTGAEKRRISERALKQDIPKILESLDLMEGNDLNNAAVVLFGTKFSGEHALCELQLARFKGTNRSEFLDAINEIGNIFHLLEKGLLFVRRNTPLSARIEPGKLQRVETPIIPFEAIREALINALIHRDYTINGGTVKLAIYDDRMEISNDGGLPAGLTFDQILAGKSKRRNPVIAEVLYKGGWIEKWGRGINEMITKCIDSGDPQPEFDIDRTDFKVIFRFAKSVAPHVVMTGRWEKSELTDRQRKILEILSTGQDMKLKEILRQLSDKPAERTLRDDLAFLREKGFIESKGSTKTMLWAMKK